MMEKYGVDQSQVDQLVKLGVASTEEAARRLVSEGAAEGLIKTAEAKKKNENVVPKPNK